MWASASLLPVRSMAIDVVPMPASSASSSHRLGAARRWPCAGCAPSSSSGVVAAVALPVEVDELRRRPSSWRRRRAAWPPMPSASDEQVRAGVARVLVAGLRAQPEVGARGVAQGDGHRRYLRSSRTVLPIRRVAADLDRDAGR